MHRRKDKKIFFVLVLEFMPVITGHQIRRVNPFELFFNHEKTKFVSSSRRAMIFLFSPESRVFLHKQHRRVPAYKPGKHWLTSFLLKFRKNLYRLAGQRT